jgi:hypothetical protein
MKGRKRRKAGIFICFSSCVVAFVVTAVFCFLFFFSSQGKTLSLWLRSYLEGYSMVLALARQPQLLDSDNSLIPYLTPE